MRHLPRSTRSRAASRRAGSFMPALAVALLAVLGSAALVIDRLALDAAKKELRSAAEAAALAAARELANDDRFRFDFQPVALQMKARFAAARIAAENLVASEPLRLNTDLTGDVRFGRLETDSVTDETIFVETPVEEEPTSVAVHARRITARDSAVPLPFRTFYAPTDADVAAVAEASIDFHVLGLRAVDDLPVPTLPLAILSQTMAVPASAEDASNKHSRYQQPDASKKPQPPVVPSWTRDIEQRRGTDRFSYDVSTGEVSPQADGIPEITLRTAASSSSPLVNAFVLTLSGDLTQDALRRQIREGWSAADLDLIGGELLFDRGPLTMAGLRGVDSNLLAQSLKNMLGQSRVVFLYDRVEGDSRASVASLHVTGIVAGRVMSVREISESECEIIFQPAVMATRSAVTASDKTDSTEHKSHKNKYVANLRLTN